jgi:hypothetical protein
MKKGSGAAVAAQLRTGDFTGGLLERTAPLGGGELRLYRAMRESLPILDAAVGKLVRLTGGFSVSCADAQAETALREFLRTVSVGRGQFGMDSFLSAYLDSLLTCGRAIGEMVVSQGRLCAVCWGDVATVEVLEGDTPLDFALAQRDETGQLRTLPYQNLLLFSTLNPDPAHPYGVSLFRSMPFLAEILMQIYRTIGLNWERAGNVRYSVVYRPNGDAADRAMASDRAQQMADEWSRAMQATRSGEVRDFVAVGDVDIRVIGADGQVLNSEVPVRQILEQLVAATGLPPFLLGLSWSSTERMSAQQADLLTSEIWAIRRAVQPVLERICRTFLALRGCGASFSIDWEDVSLQDIVDEAQAALYRAETQEILENLGGNN